VRAITGISGIALLARGAAGHCAAKAALSGHASLGEGLNDQWQCLRRGGKGPEAGLPGSPVHQHKSAAVDEAVNESFPASDPPASRLPDEPPANAEAKWAAAKAAGKVS
jgi:hypothetical protein